MLSKSIIKILEKELNYVESYGMEYISEKKT